MKKLLFLAAIATLGLTTSCKKSCDSCLVKSSAGGFEISLPVQGKELCEEAKKNAAATTGTEKVEVICQ